jgi:WD40 repeat protein
MTHLQLVLECAGSQSYNFTTDEDMLIGACVGRLVADLGYPLEDSLGSPVLYQLRVVSQLRPLPNDRLFAEVRLVSQTHVVLESALAAYATQPILAVDSPSEPQAGATAQKTSRRWFLYGSILTVLGFTGLGLGLAASQVPRYIKRTPTGIIPMASHPFSKALSAPRKAVMRLRFSQHLDTVQSLGWSPGGEQLGSGSADGGLLIWQATDGTVVHRVLYPAAVPALAWSPDGHRLVTGSANQVAFYTPSTESLLASPQQPHSAPVTALSWTSQHLQQVVSGALDHRAIVWNTANDTPQTIFAKHEAAIEDVSWSPDGHNVASCSQGGIVRVWNAQGGQELHAPFQDGQQPLRTLAFAPTDALLAVGSDDGVLRLWKNGLLCTAIGNTNGGPVCQDIPVKLATTPSNALCALAWSPDGRFLASGDKGGSCTLWRRETLQPLFSFTVPDGQAIHSLSWSPTGYEIAVASGPIVTIWVLQT